MKISNLSKRKAVQDGDLDRQPSAQQILLLRKYSAPVEEEKMNGDFSDQFLAMKKLRAEQRKSAREWYKSAKPHRAVKLAFADGSTGYGRYRRRRYYRRRRGYGGYWDDAFGKIGGLLGGYKPGSEEAGKAWGNKLWGLGRGWVNSTLAGYGRYKRRRYGRRYRGYGAYVPGVADEVQDQDVPVVTNPGGTDGPVCIRHKEYIGDVVSNNSTNFQMLYQVAINPGNPSMSPWLAQLAQNFTQYKIRGMIFHFKSTSGSLSTTQSLGEIIMAINYNATDPNFTNKQQMLNEIFAVSKVPAFDAECPVECDDKQTMSGGLLYTSQQGLIPVGQDPRFYNLGNFYLAVQGVPANGNTTLGELWVTYQVELYKPQLISTIIPSTGYSLHWAGSFAASNLNNAVFSKYTGVVLYNNFNPALVWNSNQLIFPVGTPSGGYRVSYYIIGDSTVVSSPAVSASQACVLSPITQMTTNGVNPFTNSVGTSTYFIGVVYLNLNSSIAYQAGILTIAGGTYPANAVACEVFVENYNPAMN